MMDNDLSDLKAGDLVVECGRYGFAYNIVRVDRVTPTQAVIGNKKFRLSGGYEVGSGNQYSRISISRAPHLFAKAKQVRAERGLKDGFQFSRDGVERARKAADFAEAILREMGQWDAPIADNT